MCECTVDNSAAQDREKLQLQYELQSMRIQIFKLESVLESLSTKLVSQFQTNLNLTAITVTILRIFTCRINQLIFEHSDDDQYTVNITS